MANGEVVSEITSQLEGLGLTFAEFHLPAPGPRLAANIYSICQMNKRDSTPMPNAYM